MGRKEMLKRLEQDIRDHIEQETADNIDRGLAPEEARYAAQRKFGNVQRIKEDTREVWIMPALEQFMQDTRYAGRMLRRNPGFAAIAIVTLALGIGVSTAVFSVVNTAILRPLPYPDSDRIVAFSDGITRTNPEHFKPGIAGGDFMEWQKQARSFEKIGGYDYRDLTLAGPYAASQVRVASIQGDVWALTGARAVLGRLFGPGRPEDSIVLSHLLFQRQFRGDPRIVGKMVTLDGKPVTVVGVLSPDFRFLFPQDWYNAGAGDVNAFVPGPPLMRSKPSRVFVVARLKPRTTIQSALMELEGIETSVLKAYPDRWFPGVSRMELLPLQTRLLGNNRQALLILQAAGLFVLLIACTNIANLLLARGVVRKREMAIRASMGAGASRMLRQFLAEGILLALLGGALGLLVSQIFIAMMVRFGQNVIPRLAETAIDGRVLAFTLILCVGSAVLFGCAPAISLRRANPHRSLQAGLRSSSTNVSGVRVRRFLVASELAMAIVLLTGASLMVKSFWKMYLHPPGFEPEKILIAKVSLSGTQYTEKTRQVVYIRDLLHRIASVSGVMVFGVANIEDYLLQSSNSAVPAIVDHFRESLISLGYPQAMGMRLLKGNWLKETDPPDATLINETTAWRAFGGQDPIGKRIDHLGRPIRVVGVVANLKYAKRDADPGAEIFRSYSQNLWGGNMTLTVAVRMPGDPLTLAPEVRQTIAGLDPAQPIYDIQSLEQALSDSVAPRRFNLFLLGTFAAGALLIALAGVYGVITYSVMQRTQEIGIRMALGAQRFQVLRMVLAQGIQITVWSVAAGVCAALVLTRLVAGLLYEVAPNDPWTFGVIVVSTFVIVLLASWWPAWKASRIDPQTALRQE